MKRCPRCNQIFNDDYTFCLTDGTTLVADYAEAEETPTIVHRAAPTSAGQVPTGSSRNPLTYVIMALLGVVILIIAAAGVGILIYFNLDGSGETAEKNTNVGAENRTAENGELPATNLEIPGNDKAGELTDRERELEEREANLNREKRRLEEEKKKESETVKTPAPTPAPEKPGSRSARVFDPPTNVRFSPNGAVQCVIRSRRAINIYGSTGVRDNNGVWYYTDACGRAGVIHSSQIRF